MLEAIGFFEQAIAEDPSYAHAYAGLADSYALHVDYRSIPVADAFARAKEYASKAITLDDTVAEAHVSLAWVLFIYEWEWRSAEREFRRALELDPRYATAHQWYAMLLTAQGRFEESLIEAHASLELDPGSVSIRRGVGWLYLYARRFDQALHHLARAIEMNPFAEESYRVLGLAHALHGDLTEAERVLRIGAGLPGAGPNDLGTLAYVLARGEKHAEARSILESLKQRAESDYVSPVAFAMCALGLGDTDEAFRWIERAFEERRGWLVYARVNPTFDLVRSDPRFSALLDRMRFSA